MSASSGYEQFLALFRDATPEPEEQAARARDAILVTDAVSASPRVVDDPGDVLAVEDVATLLRVGRNTVYALVAKNQIPHRRLGKQIRFCRAAVMRWLSSSWQVAK